MADRSNPRPGPRILLAPSNRPVQPIVLPRPGPVRLPEQGKPRRLASTVLVRRDRRRRDRLHPEIKIGAPLPNKEPELVHTEVRIGVPAPNKGPELVPTEVRIGGPLRSREPDRAQREAEHLVPPEAEHLVQPEAEHRAQLAAEHRALRIGVRKPGRECPARRALTIEALREQPGRRERSPVNQARVRPSKNRWPRISGRPPGTTAAP